jgi:3',5'-cyclic AMP phosphodiesterase CpdA
LRFAAFGDSGTGGRAQQRVAALLKQSDPDLLLLLGDIVYPHGGNKDYDSKYFRPYAEWLHRIPFFPALGNHDYGFKGAEKGRRRFEEGYHRIHHKPPYYSFDAGPAHFVSLDSNQAYGIEAAAPIGPGSPQRLWLEEDLASSKAPWKFVFLHVPLYTSMTHHGDNTFLRESLEPLFRKHKVDAVFQGHDHFYERSHPIGGILYVTVGTGGGGLYQISSPQEWVAKHLMVHGLLRGKLKGTRLDLEFIDEHGKVRDHFVVEKNSSTPE